MSTENTNTKESVPIDASMEKLLDFLPQKKETGGSSESTTGEEKDQEPEASAQAEEKEGSEGDQSGEENKPDKSESFDINKYFEESSEGVIKGEEDFKASLSKIKGFDELSQKVQALESERETVFANDYVKKLNNLVKSGSSQEQIESFMNLSKMDLDKLDAREALIQNEILNKGRTRALAERIVSKTYGLDALSTDDDTLTPEEIQERKDELEIVQARMQDEANPVVEGFKKELEGLSEIESPEQKKLDEAAKRKSYEKALEPFATKLAESFPTKIALPTGEEGVEISYDLPEDFAASAKQEAIEFFNHPDMEVNEKSVNEFVTTKKALFVYDKLKDITEKFYEQGKAVGVKEASAKYENPHGLENSDVDTDVTIDNLESTLMGIAKS